jgi:hypothetical protein
MLDLLDSVCRQRPNQPGEVRRGRAAQADRNLALHSVAVWLLEAR